MANTEQTTQSEGKKQQWELVLIEIGSKFGLGGIVIISFIGLFLFEGSKEQHQAFINVFFLLRFPKEHPSYAYFIYICYIILFTTVLVYYNVRLKSMNERFLEIKSQRDEFYGQILKKKEKIEKTLPKEKNRLS